MNFNEYQEKVKGFMNPKVLESDEDTFMNAILGLAGEAGEVCDVVKKARYHEGILDLDKLDKEVGDVLFYCALYAISRKHISLEGIAQKNVDKLTARYNGQPWTAEASKAKRDETIQVDHYIFEDSLEGSRHGQSTKNIDGTFTAEN